MAALVVLSAVAAPRSSLPAPEWPVLRPADWRTPLPGTEALTLTGDVSRLLVEANDRFLDERIAAVAAERAARWRKDAASGETPTAGAEAHRTSLRRMLGIGRDARTTPAEFEFHGAHKEGPLAAGPGVRVYAVRWPAFGAVHGDGLLVEPSDTNTPPVADLVLVPDAGQSPEDLAGLVPGTPAADAHALRFARAGCRVLVPGLIGRDVNVHKMPDREWLHRPAFELGRHLLGYEIQKAIAGVDGLLASQGAARRKVGIAGWGEGGLIALYSAALDDRIPAVLVSGYFGPRETLWTEPAEHNVFGLLAEFGDAEIASLISPRPLILESGCAPDFAFRPGPDGGIERLDRPAALNGKPGRFLRPTADAVAAETARLRELVGDRSRIASSTSDRPFDAAAVAALLEGLGVSAPAASGPAAHDGPVLPPADPARIAAGRATRVAEIERHNRAVLTASAMEREAYFRDLKTGSVAEFQATIEPYRERFRTAVIGDFDVPLAPPHPRSRPFQMGLSTVSYEVVLDVFPGTMAYGILTLPAGLDPARGPRRPVVVCQHGLEGRPQDVIGEAKHSAYAAFATRLAERGYVTFAPQNGYLGHDLFRLQQFKAQSIGRTLFSTIVAQHRQITDWLATLPFADPDRIAFYGLSYGGKTAMRVPPLVGRYCLSICSGDFNEWVWKNAATDERSLRYSYAGRQEYEIFEWDLGGTFNYAEMAALICPRPFMVERGHFDGVAPDEAVAAEFAKVRRLYQARLGIGDRCAIEWFAGPHAIHGFGTYEFLNRHLRPDAPRR
jgi:dienelactone hydrolase